MSTPASTDSITLCISCNCMTHTVQGRCGKCGEEKSEAATDQSIDEQLVEILEPHYWNLGFDAGKDAHEAAKRSLTFKLLQKLLLQVRLDEATQMRESFNIDDPEYDARYEADARITTLTNKLNGDD